MEKKMENEMETGGILGFKELKLSYHNGLRDNGKENGNYYNGVI